ncbi:DUF4280 domain-containing protein [Aquimarina sp. RZ0]|uniref:DUF4280 domain-containing protein n=1 Tax=Aquimarina sp. RZ0 TaxID=2607730 RepID=UPI0011F0A2E1|nr:DUF4280 domain-containing protein [Aquimarina sp. RZ0]KAA1248135.1 DUF4280 domain-containing protein [Aquimarina sp. RZ0]
MATETKEVRVAHTGISIVCDKSGGGETPSVIQSMTKSVFIDGNPVTTKADKISGANIVPFPSCDVGKMCGVCVPVIASEWELTAEKTINTEKKTPLVEDSFLQCTHGGKIAFKFDPVKTVPPANKKPNIVDKAKAKINSAVNSVVKKTTETLKDVTEGMTAAFDGLKPVLENTQAANLATTLDTQVQKLNQLKKETDNTVEDLEEEITELRKKIDAKITGTTYKPPKEEVETATVINLDKDEIDLQNAEEEKRNAVLYDQATNDAIKAYEDFINAEITPTVTIREVPIPKSNTPQVTPSVSNTASGQNQVGTKNTNSKAVLTAKEHLETLANTSKTIGLDKNENAQNALRLLDTVGTVMATGVKNSAKDKAKVSVKNVRSSLNGQLQTKIDEELTELGYYEKLKKYEEESTDLQKDIDKASLTLKSVGDFGGFIDGLKNKYLGKIGAKYSGSLNKLSNNLTTLNTSMDGLSYVADGGPKGEVFTNVIREIKEEDDENDENSNLTGAGINSGTGRSDPRDDTNLEPRILRIFVADTDKKEFMESAVDIDTELYIVIQANAKANTKTVELDLADQINHYEMIDNYKENGDGIYVITNIKGASPNFENGETYVNDGLPYTGQDLISTGGNLNDKTYVKIKAITHSIEEEEENSSIV